MNTDSSSKTPRVLEYPHFVLPAMSVDTFNSSFRNIFDKHHDLARYITSGVDILRPIMFISVRPFSTPTDSSSDFDSATLHRYGEIENDLREIEAESTDVDGVEAGAVDTAKQLVAQLKGRQLAPPELAQFGREAIIMLWASGETKLAVTVTEGEFAYTVRKNKTTVAKGSGLSSNSFDLLRLT